MDNDTVKIELYKAYLEDLGRIGTHHTQTRAFYVSIISALLVLLSSSIGLLQIHSQGQIAISFLGIVLCFAWRYHIFLFHSLYRAKFDILRQMEEKFGFPFKIFVQEGIILFPQKHNITDKTNKYSWFTDIESLVAVLVSIPFLILLITGLIDLLRTHS